MVFVKVSVHPQGLHPIEACHAWRLNKEEGISLEDCRDEVVNLEGKKPSKKAVLNGVRIVQAVHGISHLLRAPLAHFSEMCVVASECRLY